MALSKIDAANFLTGTIPQGNVANASLGAVTALPAAIATGKVLQVVEAEITSQISTTSNSFTDTGLNANITPSSTSNKVLVIVTHSGARKQTDTQLAFKLFRDTSVDLGQTGNYDSGDTQQFTDTVTWTYLDSPNTTSQMNYKTQYRSGNGTIYANTFKNKITLMEIAG